MFDYLLQLKFENEIWVFLIPIILMAIDIITGYYNAWEKNIVLSSKMRDGIGKKIAEICYIVIGTLFGYAFNIKYVMYFISLYISYMEIVSIQENCKKLGFGLTEEEKKILAKKIKEQGEGGAKDEKNKK